MAATLSTAIVLPRFGAIELSERCIVRSSAAPIGRTSGRTSRSQQVAAELESQILRERLPAGTRLALRTELITRFSVSAPVINEALRILRERELVTVKPGPKGGVFVANPPPQVRLGGIDLWFQGLSVEPEQLFEARRYLDQVFATVALH
ncbi:MULTISPECIES: FadR/GntR family transcriptional regulator [Amycolatopsis methanolica group]|uniref:FadR/GntR family transcriptional regulator n=1 Tax=Amycolatopsis methanolica group TaxID=2893674 RepID=UPI0034174F1B